MGGPAIGQEKRQRMAALLARGLAVSHIASRLRLHPRNVTAQLAAAASAPPVPEPDAPRNYRCPQCGGLVAEPCYACWLRAELTKRRDLKGGFYG